MSNSRRSLYRMLPRLLAGLGTGFVSSAALTWWLSRYEPLDSDDYARLQEPVAGDSDLIYQIDSQRLRQHTEALAVITNRRSGSAGELTARRWVKRQFKGVGLRRVHAEPVVYPRWRRRGRSELTFFTPAPYSPDFILLYGSSSTPAAGLESPLVDVGSGSEEAYAERAGKPLQGAVHLVRQSREARRDLVLRATRHGAAAVILANANTSPRGKPLIENGTAVVLLGRIPALAISHEAGLTLGRQLEQGPVRCLLHVSAGYSPAVTANVVGEIPGRQAEYVLLAAHYDAWYAGAADNAAGLACLLELARVWAKARLRPHRTIRFVSFGAEEVGLMGSLFEVVTRAPLVKARCRGVITPDVVGVPAGALRLGASPQALAEVTADLAQQMGYSEATGYPITIEGAPAYADHWPYAQLLLPALVVSKGPDARYHTPYDTAERLDYDDLRWTAALVGAMALRLAQR